LNSNHLFAYIRDITKYENTYSDLESLNKKLKSTWGMFEKMFSVLVHDSNNYLNPAIMLSKLFDVSVNDITTNLQILFDKTASNRQVILNQLNEDVSTLGSFSKALCVSSDHLKNLLSKFLLQINMSGNMKYEKVNLGIIAMNEVDALRPLSMTKNVSIDCRVSPLLYVNTDSMMLSTIIRNLLSNAIKFTPELKSVKITANSQSDKILVCIEDEGVGISESDQKLIFSNHANHIGNETLDEKMRSQKNTGLGLVFVKDLIDMLGETISVQSELSKGTKFTFTLQKWDDY
jgi:signal transduction histidine kinase